MTQQSKKSRFSQLALVGVLVGAMSTQACVMSPRTAMAFGNFAATAVYAAAIIGAASILVSHDHHYHYDTCGHYRQWHQGRWVYEYGGHWEYYDSYQGRWYYYN